MMAHAEISPISGGRRVGAGDDQSQLLSKRMLNLASVLQKTVPSPEPAPPMPRAQALESFGTFDGLVSNFSSERSEMAPPSMSGLRHTSAPDHAKFRWARLQKVVFEKRVREGLTSHVISLEDMCEPSGIESDQVVPADLPSPIRPSTAASMKSAKSFRFLGHCDSPADVFEQMERQALRQISRLRQENRVFLGREAHSVSFRRQGDLEMYTATNLKRRTTLQQYAPLQTAIQKFWDLQDLPKNYKGCISWETYRNLNIKLHRALVPDVSNGVAEKSAKSDWKRDSEGRTDMDEQLFKKSMFELADIWCADIDGEQYTNFLLKLYDTVAHEDGRLKLDVDIQCCLEGLEDGDGFDMFTDFDDVISEYQDTMCSSRPGTSSSLLSDSASLSGHSHPGTPPTSQNQARPMQRLFYGGDDQAEHPPALPDGVSKLKALFSMRSFRFSATSSASKSSKNDDPWGNSEPIEQGQAQETDPKIEQHPAVLEQPPKPNFRTLQSEANAANAALDEMKTLSSIMELRLTAPQHSNNTRYQQAVKNLSVALKDAVFQAGCMCTERGQVSVEAQGFNFDVRVNQFTKSVQKLQESLDQATDLMKIDVWAIPKRLGTSLQNLKDGETAHRYRVQKLHNMPLCVSQQSLLSPKLAGIHQKHSQHRQRHRKKIGSSASRKRSTKRSPSHGHTPVALSASRSAQMLEHRSQHLEHGLHSLRRSRREVPVSMTKWWYL